jgi:membrane protein DedA with SNARE-associated domain
MMNDIVDYLMAHLGYPQIFLLMFLENLFPPIPSELIMPFAGYRVAQGELSLVPTVLSGLAGSLCGQLFWYGVAYKLGFERFSRIMVVYGKWFCVKQRDLDTAYAWFERHGKWTVFFGRLLPAIRTLISVPAGLLQMRLSTFTMYTTLGSAIWVVFLTVLGVTFGEHYTDIADTMAPYGKIILGVTLVLSVGGWVYYKRNKRISHE